VNCQLRGLRFKPEGQAVEVVVGEGSAEVDACQVTHLPKSYQKPFLLPIRLVEGLINPVWGSEA